MFLSDGRELPTLHFHDGGSTGLLHALQRYVFLNRYMYDRSVYGDKRKGGRVRRERGRGEGGRDSGDFSCSIVYWGRGVWEAEPPPTD